MNRLRLAATATAIVATATLSACASSSGDAAAGSGGAATAPATTAASTPAGTAGGGTTAGGCTWVDATASNNPDLKDTGTPPKSDIKTTGTRTMTIKLAQGTVVARLDAAHAPCTVASFDYLAGRHFFDNTTCHRLTTSSIHVLQCGDPSGTGAGGPSYQFADENLPSGPSAYQRGVVAMANAGLGTNGSQFFIVYGDTPIDPNYTIFGTVTSGMSVIDKIAAAGTKDGSGDGAPKNPVTMISMTVN